MIPRRNVPLVFATIVLVVAVAAWIAQSTQARALAREQRERQAERERLDQVITRLQQQVRAPRAGLPPDPVQASAPAPQPSKSSGSTPPGALDLQQLFREHPEWRPIYVGSERAAALRNYAAFVASAALSASQTEQLAAELMRHQEAEEALGSRSAAAGNPAELVAAQRDENMRHADAVRTVLGEEAYRRFEDFERSLPVRPFVEELIQRLYATDQPLTSGAAEELTTVLARHAAGAEGKVERHGLNWDAALTEARGLLSAKQFAELTQVREATELQNKMNQIVRRAARKSH